MRSRVIADIKDAAFMDSSLTYNGANTTAITMKLTGGTTWGSSEFVTLTASAAYFTAADVGNGVRIDGDLSSTEVIITAYTSPTVVTVQIFTPVPVELQAPTLGTVNWTKLVDELVNLWHLEGQPVSVFADGYVKASPFNPDYDIIVVKDGKISLDHPFGKIHVGIPYFSRITTLDLDFPGVEPIFDKLTQMARVALLVEKTRGLFTGVADGPAPGDPTDDIVGGGDGKPQAKGVQPKLRRSEGYESPVSMVTGPIDVMIPAGFTKTARVIVQQSDPLPATILAVCPSGTLATRR
jgi:hypothetical protein